MWESHIKRAEQLAARDPAVKELLSFYAKLLGAQQEVYEGLHRQDWQPSGALESDLPVLRALLPRLLKVVAMSAPDALAVEAQRLLQSGEPETDQLLLNYWREPDDIQFFPKAFLQPYAQWLLRSKARTPERNPGRGEQRCPQCGGKPQLSLLLSVAGAQESGGRMLVCATCLSAWAFHRVVCAHCGEERPAKLGYFSSSEYQHVRLEVCDTCKHYLKGIDLTRFGLAVPLVDEMAAAPLDLWAKEQGYTKIELNLVGL